MQQYLALDIGNTRIKAVHESPSGRQRITVEGDAQGISSLLDFVRKLQWSQEDVLNTAFCQTSDDAEGLLEPLFEGLDVRGPFVNISDIGWPFGKLHYSSQVGADRLAAAYAAVQELYKNPSQKCILVADAGTCLTFEMIERGEDKTYDYYPLSISPGVQMRLNAMHEGTGRLPMVSLEDWPQGLAAKSADYPRGDTTSAMLAGAVFGLANEICGQVHRLGAEGHFVDALMLTGGDAMLLIDPVRQAMTNASTIYLKSRPLPPDSTFSASRELETEIVFMPGLVVDGLLVAAHNLR